MANMFMLGRSGADLQVFNLKVVNYQMFTCSTCVFPRSPIDFSRVTDFQVMSLMSYTLLTPTYHKSATHSIGKRGKSEELQSIQIDFEVRLGHIIHLLGRSLCCDLRRLPFGVFPARPIR
jgi:hypothetical protein